MAVRELRQGGLIVYPTEAVFGLGCDPYDSLAVEQILRLKNRPLSKGLIVIAADYRQLEGLVGSIDRDIKARMLASWPGPTTWVVPASAQAPRHLCRQDGTIAVRVTAHALTSALCRGFGKALISTSANPAGRSPARTALKVRNYFPNSHLIYVPGATGGMSNPSAIYDAISGKRLR